ncbi:hypothetical protein NCC49_000801 [Naganishia albida]|nr:hypothetical protein NCC49_000801 [Naganishia albida]
MQTTNTHPRSRNFAQEFPGWVEQFDPNYNAWFYVNKATGQSQWTHPGEEPQYAPPSGPPPTNTSNGYPSEKASYSPSPALNSAPSYNDAHRSSSSTGQQHVEAYQNQPQQQQKSSGGFLGKIQKKLEQKMGQPGMGGGMGGGYGQQSYGGGYGGGYAQQGYGGYPQQGGMMGMGGGRMPMMGGGMMGGGYPQRRQGMGAGGAAALGVGGGLLGGMMLANAFDDDDCGGGDFGGGDDFGGE